MAAAVAALGGGAIAASATYRGLPSNKPPVFIRHARVSDKFLNYDGVGGSTTQNTRDWPITIIWTKDATKHKVKLFTGLNKPSQLRGYVRGGKEISEPERKRDTNQYRVASDKGNKTECGSKPKDLHVRFYAATWNPNASYLYDPSSGGWKWFVVTSTHYDFAEERYPKLDNGQANPCYRNGFTSWEGRSEQAAGEVEDSIVKPDTHGYFGAVKCDQVNTKNYEGEDPQPPRPPPGECAPVPHRRMSDDPAAQGHYWQNDGLASLIPVNSP